MKKPALRILPLLLAICLLAGCSGSGMTELKSKYSEINSLYNEVAALVSGNGWLADKNVSADMEAISTSLQKVKSVIDSPDSLGAGDPKELTAALENFRPILQQYKEVCSQPYTTG